jgi:hypothetical protein
LRATLEQENPGEAVAIYVDSEEYALGDSHSAARRTLENSHPDGAIVTLTVGPPTLNDFAVAYRILLRDIIGTSKPQKAARF